MTKGFATSVLALGFLAGCAGLPGGECKFAKGEVSASATGEAKAFLDAAMDLKKTAEAIEVEWKAEITALAGELKVEAASEDAVLAKINANVTELKAQGECTVEFDFKAEASASGSADASGKAGTGEGAKGDGKASGAAAAKVDVKLNFTCKAEAKVKGTLDVTTAAIKGHFPKLLGIAVSVKDLIPKITATAEAGANVMGSLKDPMLLGEIKCGVEAVTGVKANMEVKAEFSVKASASAKGEGSAKSG